MAASDGVKVAVYVWVPARGVVPLAGLYTKLPATLPDALSWVAESAVPYVMAPGIAHVTVGTALLTTSKTVLLAVL